MAHPDCAQAALVIALLAGGGLPARAGDWELRVCADPDNLPFSNRAGEGFDNRIAEILAEALDADLSYVWLPDTRGRTRQRYVQAGECDLVMGVIEGQPGFLTSHAYYRTGYVFLYPEDAGFEIASLDDPILRELRIGLQGGARKLTPPSVALANRGIVENQVHFIDRRAPDERYPPVLTALRDGAVDAAIVWGPLAGWFARGREAVKVAPVRPEIDLPFIPMVAPLTIGVRPEDEALRDEIDTALAQRWDDVGEALREAGTPLLPLPRPRVSLGGGG